MMALEKVFYGDKELSAFVNCHATLPHPRLHFRCCNVPQSFDHDSTQPLKKRIMQWEWVSKTMILKLFDRRNFSWSWIMSLLHTYMCTCVHTRTHNFILHKHFGSSNPRLASWFTNKLLHYTQIIFWEGNCPQFKNHWPKRLFPFKQQQLRIGLCIVFHLTAW